MPRRRQKTQGLSPAEWAVMKVLWDGGPMALGEIVERVAGERDWSYSTVKTIARRMVAKGWLRARRVGGSFLYQPAVPRGKAVRSAVREFADRVLDGVLSPFVAYYAEEQELSDEDLAELEALIKKHRRRRGRS